MSKFQKIFRTGSEKDSTIELILNNLNQSRGTAYAAYDLTSTDTVVYAENYAIACAIANLWESNARLTNQFDPLRMGVYLDRWERILGIARDPNNSISARKAIIAAKMALLTNAPTSNVLVDLCRSYLGDMFVEIFHYTAEDNLGGMPGGCTVPGGVTLEDNIWWSPISIMDIRTWQVRDKYNNYLYDEKIYNKKMNELSYVLEGFLPAYMMVSTFRYIYQGQGTISSTTSHVITGTGTDFENDLEVGAKIETVDDENNLQTFTIIKITDAEHITVEEEIIDSLTGCYYRLQGFILDYPHNLDNLTFGQMA